VFFPFYFDCIFEYLESLKGLEKLEKLYRAIQLRFRLKWLTLVS